MTDHAHELRRYARKIAHPAGDVPAVMRAAAAEIERMQAKIEAAEKEVAHIKEVEFPRKARAVAAGWETKCARLEQERDALRAKIEAMERQEPVATVRINAINGNPSVDFVPGHHYLHHNDRLYLAPGAQPAPSVPEGWKLVPIEPTPGMMRAALCALVDTRGNSALFRATLNRWIATIFTPCLSWCQVCIRCDPTFGRSNQ